MKLNIDVALGLAPNTVEVRRQAKDGRLHRRRAHPLTAGRPRRHGARDRVDRP